MVHKWQDVLSYTELVNKLQEQYLKQGNDLACLPIILYDHSSEKPYLGVNLGIDVPLEEIAPHKVDFFFNVDDVQTQWLLEKQPRQVIMFLQEIKQHFNLPQEQVDEIIKMIEVQNLQ